MPGPAEPITKRVLPKVWITYVGTTPLTSPSGPAPAPGSGGFARAKAGEGPLPWARGPGPAPPGRAGQSTTKARPPPGSAPAASLAALPPPGPGQYVPERGAGWAARRVSYCRGGGRCGGHRWPAGGGSGEAGRWRSRIAAPRRDPLPPAPPSLPRARHLAAPVRPRCRRSGRRRRRCTSGRGGVTPPRAPPLPSGPSRAAPPPPPRRPGRGARPAVGRGRGARPAVGQGARPAVGRAGARGGRCG